MIDIHNEQLCLLTEASDSIPSRPSYCTLMRWKREGLRGIRLETLQVGGRIFTSDQAINRFIARLSNRHVQAERNVSPASTPIID